MRKGMKNLLRVMLLSFLVLFGIQQPYQAQAASGTIRYGRMESAMLESIMQKQSEKKERENITATMAV